MIETISIKNTTTTDHNNVSRSCSDNSRLKNGGSLDESKLVLAGTAAIDSIERVLDEEIARLVGGGITADELTRAVNRAEIEYAHQLENYDSRADLIGMLSTYFDDPTIVNTWLDPYRASTTADVAAVAAKYLVPENRATSVFVPQG